MNVFIDTNIYLTFYHFSSDDLEQLKKITVALKKGKIKLFLTDQVMSEYKRNRENKIADAIEKFDEQKIPKEFPQIVKNYSEYDNLTKSVDAYYFLKSKLIKKLREDALSNNFLADKLIIEIFDLAEKITTSDEMKNKAKERFDLGNPPGKNKSYGDAINWIDLLEYIPKSEDLHLIARDKDFYSVIDKSSVSQFLSEEWVKEKDSKVYLYDSLTNFFSKHFPDIKLATEMDKKFAIEDLASVQILGLLTLP